MQKSRNRLGWLALSIALAVAGSAVIIGVLASRVAPPPRPLDTSLGVPQPTTSPLPALAASQPVRLDIDRINVHAPIAAAGTTGDGQVAVPPLDQPWLTNWYDRGPSPGERGNAVIVGHVDTRRVGAAVFYSLGRLHAGDTVQITRSDGVTAVFTVDAVALIAKAQFPAGDVYGPSDRPSLRLITCGGDFDSAKHNYLANTIVTATLTSWHSAAGAVPAPLTTFIPDLPPPPKAAPVKPKPKSATQHKPAAQPKPKKASKPKPKAKSQPSKKKSPKKSAKKKPAKKKPRKHR